MRFATACEHTEAKHYCKGMCSNCYCRAKYERTIERQRANAKARYARNKPKLLATSARYYQRNKARFREYARKFLYGMTPEAHAAMLLEQGGRCAMCKTHESELGRALHIDHCHTTGKVRALLCQKCNTALGYYEKLLANPDFRICMDEYLRKAAA